MTELTITIRAMAQLGMLRCSVLTGGFVVDGGSGVILLLDIVAMLNPSRLLRVPWFVSINSVRLSGEKNIPFCNA